MAYRKARDGHGYRLPDFTVGNPATVRHERFEVRPDYVRDPVTYELDEISRVDWKLVPYGELLNSASERHPVRQTIEPADWYYNEDEKDEEHPNLVIMSGQLSVAGLATILRMNQLYRLQHEGSHGSRRRVISWRDGELKDMRQAIDEEFGIDMSAEASLSRGNAVLPDDDNRWLQTERSVGSERFSYCRFQHFLCYA